MAVDDLWHLSRVPENAAPCGEHGQLVASGRHGRGKRYRVRYIDPSGELRQQLFNLKTDADRFDASMRADVARGDWVDPRAGRQTFREAAEHWRGNQVHADNTAKLVEMLFRRHVYPFLGGRPMVTIKRSDIQALIKHLSLGLAPKSVRLASTYVGAVFRAAVMDGDIPRSPCVDLAMPDAVVKLVSPLSVEMVESIRDHTPARYRALADLGSMAGLRQGEAIGLEVEHIDFLRRTIRVEQQLHWRTGVPPFIGQPKTPGSRRTIPVGQVLIDQLAAHLAEFPPLTVRIVDRTGRQPVERPARLVTLSPRNLPIKKPKYYQDVWAPIMRRMGLDGDPDHPTFHDFRHHYASALIAHGASATVVCARLGNSVKETLTTYSHLWPGDDDKTRDAIDALRGTTSATAPRLRRVE